jgi:hypothetical protein
MSAPTDAVRVPSIAASANSSPEILNIVLWCMCIVVVVVICVAGAEGARWWWCKKRQPPHKMRLAPGEDVGTEKVGRRRGRLPRVPEQVV